MVRYHVLRSGSYCLPIYYNLTNIYLKNNPYIQWQYSICLFISPTFLCCSFPSYTSGRICGHCRPLLRWRHVSYFYTFYSSFLFLMFNSNVDKVIQKFEVSRRHINITSNSEKKIILYEEDDWHSILSKKYLGWLQRGSNHSALGLGASIIPMVTSPL